MRKSIISFLVVGLLVSMFMTPQTAHAQISFPAEMNKAFSPTSIAAGAKSRLSVTIFNPNSFALTNATWTDNLPVGITVANPVNLSNSCVGGTVTAVAGGTSFSLSGGTVPAQVGLTPGSCTVAIDVTSSTPGNLVNTIPAGSLSTANNVTTTSPASATLNVVGSPPPTVSKSFNPITIWAGQTSRLTINIRNNASTPLTQASLTDNLPTNVFLANPVSPTLSGCGAGTLTAVSGGTSVTLNDATIAPNSTCTITVNVTSNVQAAYTNTIPTGALDTFENLTNTTPATAQLNVDLIRISKTFIPLTISPGETSTLIITLENPTGSPYTGVNVTDNLPSPLIVNGAASSTCIPPGTVSTTSTSVTLAGGIIPAGSILTPGTCTIRVPVTVPAGTPSDRYRNIIRVNDVSTDQGVGIRQPAVADLRVAGSEVTGTKRFIQNPITAGGNSRLRIEITAPGDTNLTIFSMTDDLPVGVTVSNTSPPTISAGCGPTAALSAPTGANSITLTSDLILSGQTCMIEVSVTSSVTGTHTNTISPTDITNFENRTTIGDLIARLTVNAPANLAIDIVKDFNPLLVSGGASSTMSILLINPGGVALTGIAFTDNMPVGMILANPVNPNVGTCGGTLTGIPGSNSFSFSGGSLPVGGNCTLTLSATITVNGNLTNTIPAGAVTTTEGATNPDLTSATLTNLPGASISKSFAPNPIAAGSFSLLTITIQNTGSIALTGMGLDDNLPAGLVVAGPPAPAPVNNCGGTFSAATGASTVQLTNGELAGNSACTIVVGVTGGTPGDYLNTIPAGALITDPALNTTNTTPATATLTITGNPGGGGGGGGGNRIGDDTADPVASSFLIPLTGFAPGRETKLADSPHTAYEATSLLLDIPVLKVKAPIVGVESRNGRWDVSWLQQVGWLSGSAYPTWKGNSLLTAHVVNADGKPGVFSKLKFLGVGEYIFVYNSGYRYTYQVVSNGFVQPNDSRVMKHEEKSYLTLITCDGYNEKTGAYLRRVVVRAVLVDVSAVK